MRRTVRLLAFVCTIGGLVIMSGSQSGQEKVAAQQSVPTLTRMYTGPDGLTHFREIPMPVGQFTKVAGYIFNRPRPGQAPNDRPPEFHNASNRRLVITLSGKAEIVGSAGNQLFIADKDHMLLAEDLTGKGHTTKGIDWVTLFVEIDQPKE